MVAGGLLLMSYTTRLMPFTPGRGFALMSVLPSLSIASREESETGRASRGARAIVTRSDETAAATIARAGRAADERSGA